MTQIIFGTKDLKNNLTMKKVIFVLGAALLCSTSYSQTIGKTKTEDYKASFETKSDISQFLDYEGPKKNIQLLKCGINDEMYEIYPELKFLSDATVDPVKFNQSTISISTKKALDIACANILGKMVKKGVFTK
jgi:hypothetical protein